MKDKMKYDEEGKKEKRSEVLVEENLAGILLLPANPADILR